MAEKLLHENEVKTNISAAKALTTLGLLSLLFSLLDIYGILDVVPNWSVHPMLYCTVFMFVLCIYIRKKKFDKPYIKTLILAALIAYTGILHCLFPITSVFFLFGPILISIRYYNEKFTLRVSVATWLVYIGIITANTILERTSQLVHDLHVFQTMQIWQYPLEVFLYYGIVRTVLIAVTATISMHVVINGKNMILTQDTMYRKTSEMKSELDAAARIQASTMAAPAYETADQRIRVYAGIDPARDVGGDFYDRFHVDENILCLVVADVSDKGISAAMFSMRALTAIRYTIRDMMLREEPDLAGAVTRMNQLLVHSNGENMFVTLWIGCIDSGTGVGKYVNAGHMPPVIRHKDGSIGLLESEPQLMIGMFPEAQYRSVPFRLQDGDCMILYTDGITDARNTADEEFGMKGLLRTVKNGDPELYRNPQNVYSYLAGTVDGYTAGTTQFDDETVMVVNYDGEAEALKGEITVTEEKGLWPAAEQINSGLRENNCPEDVRRAVDVIIDEIGTNVLDYGFAEINTASGDLPEPGSGNGTPSAVPVFTIRYEIGGNYIFLLFRDNGIRFDPTAVPEMEISGEPQIGGLGIHLVKNLSDSLKYRYEDGYNELLVEKVWSTQKGKSV